MLQNFNTSNKYIKLKLPSNNMSVFNTSNNDKFRSNKKIVGGGRRKQRTGGKRRTVRKQKTGGNRRTRTNQTCKIYSKKSKYRRYGKKQNKKSNIVNYNLYEGDSTESHVFRFKPHKCLNSEQNLINWSKK